MAERMTVNHDVAGSSPAGGAIKKRLKTYGFEPFLHLPIFSILGADYILTIRYKGDTIKIGTPPNIFAKSAEDIPMRKKMSEFFITTIDNGEKNGYNDKGDGF